MGSIWLNGRSPGYPNLLDVLRNGGVSCSGYPGWENNSRSSGGFEKLLGVLCHHTASNTTPANDLNYMATGPDNPISNGLLDRDGHFTALAVGASNHGGKGGGSSDGGGKTWKCSKGTVPANSSNSHAFGIECANAGTGQAYPEAQQDAYTLMCAALCDAYGLVPATDVISHQEWSPPRKCDPTGPSRFEDGNNDGCNNAPLWRMNTFRAEVQSLMGGGGPVPGPTPQGDIVLYLLAVKGANAKFVGMIDAKGLGHTISWVRDEAEYDLYARLGAAKRELGMADLKGLWLVGSLPTGDTLHTWTGAEFHVA